MRWLCVSLLVLGCEPPEVDAPRDEAIVELCGNFIGDADGLVDEPGPMVADQGEDVDGLGEVEDVGPRPPPDTQGVMVVEPLPAPAVEGERVPLERGDLDTSPLPRCRPWPACLEGLVLDKPLSARSNVGLWLYDGQRLTPGPRTRALAGPLDGVVIADLQRQVLYEPATRASTTVVADGALFELCTGDEGASVRECQRLDLALGVVELSRER